MPALVMTEKAIQNDFRRATFTLCPDAIFVCRHFLEAILTMSRKSKFRVAADGTLTKTEPTQAERKTSLIEEFGLSEEIVETSRPMFPEASHLLDYDGRWLSPSDSRIHGKCVRGPKILSSTYSRPRKLRRGTFCTDFPRARRNFALRMIWTLARG
jgi:hypothetical protein